MTGSLPVMTSGDERHGVVDWRTNRWVQVTGLCLLYLVAGRLGHLLAIPPGLATPVWLPSGITLAAIVLFGPRLWPGVFLGAFLTSAIRVGDLHSIGALAFTATVGLFIAVAVTAEPLVAARLLRRLRMQGQFLSRARNVSILLLVAVPVSCALTATLASTAMAALGLIQWTGFEETWITWMVGDVAGVYFVTPALLIWSEGSWGRMRPGDRAVAAVSICCLAAASAITFLDIPPFAALPPLHFLPIPPLVFIAYRFDNRFASLVGPALAAAAILAAANGFGPFGGGPSNENLLMLQLYILVGVLTALFTRALANERDEAERAARRLSTDLAHISRVTMMGEIAAGMAHEYHQPLTAIANYATVALIKLRKHGEAYAEVRDSLEQITEETLRAAEVVDRLKGFLQKREPLRAPCDVNEIVTGAVHLAEMAHLSPRVSIRYELTPGLPLLEADSVQITQVLLNLIVNSCEAVDSSGAGAGVVLITAALAGSDMIRIDVGDDGPGLDERSARHCFDQFYSTKEGGLGVGLGISRTLVAAHGGRLEHVPSDGRGATFRLELPLPRSQPRTTSKPTPGRGQQT